MTTYRDDRETRADVDRIWNKLWFGIAAALFVTFGIFVLTTGGH